jgi:hypothetical protein
MAMVADGLIGINTGTDVALSRCGGHRVRQPWVGTGECPSALLPHLPLKVTPFPTPVFLLLGLKT